jgi:hypothetical protein
MAAFYARRISVVGKNAGTAAALDAFVRRLLA